MPTRNPPQPSSEFETLVDQLSPAEPCPQDTSHAPQEPHLGRVERCDDPHTVCIVVILNGEIGGCDDARGASKVGITHASCREKMKVSFRWGLVPIPTSHSQPRRDWSLYSLHPGITFCFPFSSLIVLSGFRGKSQFPEHWGRRRPHMPSLTCCPVCSDELPWPSYGSPRPQLHCDQQLSSTKRVWPGTPHVT